MEGGRGVDATADLLTAGQIGLMVTSRVDPLAAAALAEQLAADVDRW
jgi:TetR/AcrR family transcriptional repressor of nem operon